MASVGLATHHNSVLSEGGEMRNTFNIFNSTVFVEIGEAIGNVRRRLQRRSHPRLVDREFRRRLKDLSFQLPPAPGPLVKPQGEVIEADYRFLDDEEVQP